MLCPQLRASAQRYLSPNVDPDNSPILACLLSLTRFHLLPSFNPHTHQRRPASHATQGRANKAAPGPGKRLGAKKTALAPVVPGNIIFRQRGTHWFPGENCGIGRDHTIYALKEGFVRYYRDPERDKAFGGGRKGQNGRGYIGVVHEQRETLPRGRGKARVRRVGMVRREMGTLASVNKETESRDNVLDQENNTLKDMPNSERASGIASNAGDGKATLTLRPGYMYRETNWEIGRAAEKAKIKVRLYKPGARFLAWRKKNVRKAKAAERRGIRGIGGPRK